MAIRGVLLDVDGTLVESNGAHAEAWQEALAEHDHIVPYDRIRPLIGMGGDQLVATLVPSLRGNVQAIKEIAQAHERTFLAQYARYLQPQPGSRALVELLKQRGLELAIATSSHQQVLQVLLDRADISGLIVDKTSASQVAEAKPSPDVVETALGELRLPPSEAYLIGDTIYDVASGKRAGVGVIALLCGGTPREKLVQAGAIAIYASPEDLLAHYDTSPLGSQGRH
ncbi:MAG TPA: HAD family hydrolase [Ktedonobacterales bacterium]